MTPLWQAILLILAAAAIPVHGKVTATSGNLQVKVLKAPSTPKKKAVRSCEADGSYYATTCNASEQMSKAACIDQHADCPVRASKGECEMNGNFMLKQWQESCFVCGTNG